MPKLTYFHLSQQGTTQYAGLKHRH